MMTAVFLNLCCTLKLTEKCTAKARKAIAQQQFKVLKPFYFFVTHL